eukprot:TRINITY_DN750_c0_g1_i1.p1 TRINITY_DN750_c0_g1~~TRINITY_DN750_c0_g1_i1.p1  ORF type:complete len:415 (+),score=112.24 TRINITY_DN750_c0_g1_i1:51-1295(+)
MIHSLFILNDTGDVLIEKHWRGLINRNVCDYFWDEVAKAPAPDAVSPILVTPKYYLIHVQRNKLYFLCVVQQEMPPLLVIDFLHRVCDIFQEYFGSVSETTLKENFVHVYQLLEEMMDSGLPFTTEPNVLRDMIPPPTVLGAVFHAAMGHSSLGAELPGSVPSSIPWRKQGVKYANNEIFFDIIEELDCIIDQNGLVISAEASGEVQTNCKLSGMPDLTLVFSNPHSLDDVSFHPCVRYNRWEVEKVLSFIPPDGTFKLMNYRVKGQLQMPIYVKPQINFTESGGRVNVMVGIKNVGNDKPVEGVVITIPFPKSILSTNLSANVGAVNYDEVTKICTWNIGKIPRDKTPQLQGSVSLPPGGPPPDGNPTLTAQFKIMMYASSGIKVSSLACSERYKPYKGVRTITKAGKFQIRS